MNQLHCSFDTQPKKFSLSQGHKYEDVELFQVAGVWKIAMHIVMDVHHGAGTS